MGNGLVKIDSSIIFIDEFSSFSVIGDPGCDGLGAATMSVFAKALNFPGVDFNIIAGDIVPFGSAQLYDNVKEFINTVSIKTVYTLCGNHDTDFFDSYFGKRVYALVSDDVLLIVLDNSNRKFSEESLRLCREVLEKYSRKNIMILFHIPPPNSFTENSMNPASWLEFQQIYMPYKENIKYFVCGHLHSFFEDSVDGIPLIVTGGGGARLEFVSEKIEKEKRQNHIVRFFLDGSGQLKYSFESLETVEYSKELEDDKLKEYLHNAFVNECIAHFKYKNYSEAANAKGFTGLSHLFRALSDSEYYHARNHSCVLNEFKDLTEALSASSGSENYEIETMYKDYIDYSTKQNHGLAKYTFWDAWSAEKVHKKLLDEAIVLYKDGKDIEPAAYYTCSSCGFTFRAGDHPGRCPVCGAPQDKIFQIQ